MGMGFRIKPEETVHYVVIDGSNVLHIARHDREWTHSACGRWYYRSRVVVCQDLEEFDEARDDFTDIYKKLGRETRNSACFLVGAELKDILVKDFGFHVCLVCEQHR